MRSSVAFALIGLACWTTIAAADDATPGPTEKRGGIVAMAPRQVDTTHGLSTAPDRAGAAVIANITGAGASTVQPPATNATANIMIAHGERYHGYAPASVSTVGVVTAAFSPVASVAVSPTGTDRTGAVAGFGSVQTATLRPMGTSATAGNFTVVAVRPDATAQPDGIVPVASVLNAAAAATWTTGLTRGVESTNVRATVLADIPGGGVLTQRLGSVAPRAVNVRNRLTSIGGSTRPIRNKH